MKKARDLYGLVVLILLGAGYLASQFAAWSGSAAEYSARVDVPAIQALAIVVLAVGVGLGFVRDQEESA